MSTESSRKPFPLPVVAFGPGSQSEDESLDYMPMPSGMDTYRAPVLPEPEEAAPRTAGRAVLRRALDALGLARTGATPEPISLQGLGPEDQALVNQVLGEGEVSARVTPQPGLPLAGSVLVQESVFAGLWRVIETLADGQVRDTLEAGGVPQVLQRAAAEDGLHPLPTPGADSPLPDGVMNSPLLITEIEDQIKRWPQRAASEAHPQPHVVNLTLLPMSPQDIGWLDTVLGTGRVLILSRGYGNCRITNSRRPNTWRVVYYNSQDTVILNTVEVCTMPDVACAAREDLVDSHERLAEVLQWLEGA
ncbi:HupH hydrogenase expression protein [Burkholderiales bacterium JOSHI_001]|nr:HupH hydrogenase expression protein [Burkholderiales bacterium JOSHI_001]